MSRINKQRKSALKKIASFFKPEETQELKLDIPSIEVKNFTKKFGRFISTHDLSFSVGHGVIHGFIGPNGSGKTTTMKSLIGAYIPSSGQLSVGGYKAGTIKANKLIGYIPERASFPKHLNSVDYLKTMGEVSGLKSKVARQRAIEILEALGLKKQMKRKPITFSSGMQKKILLAQSLLTNPSILILDEPAANLDPSARSELFDQLIELRDQGKTIFISSHVLAELERIVDEITFIYFGELLYSGKVSEFTEKTDIIFIKTTNNDELIKVLDQNKINWTGDPKTEIQILNITKSQSKNLLHTLLISNKFDVLAFRNNDLQSSYEQLAHEADIKKLGKQTLKGKSTIQYSSSKKGGK